MPRRPGKIPSYCLHKHSGQAVVRIGGQDRYLGTYGTPESHEAYERHVAEWRASQPIRVDPAGSGIGREQADLTVNELILAFWKHVCSYYVKNGRPTDEQVGIRSALRPLRRLHGGTSAQKFGPLKLKTVRQAMIEADLSRGVVNQYINRVRRMFKWGVENELVPAEVYQALMAVNGLRKGRSAARETPKVVPVPDEHFQATLPYLPATQPSP